MYTTYSKANSTLVLAVLLIALCSSLTLAQNTRTILPVTVAPQVNGALTPNTTYAYNFVFASTTVCTSLLNVSKTIATDSRGIGSAELNITNLSTTPNYICEYVNGTLRTRHPVFSSTFERQTTDADILAFGYNHTATLDTYFLRNSTVPTCNSTQYLTSNGNGVFSCSQSSGSSSGTVMNISAGGFLLGGIITINGTIALDTNALIANIGNYSDDKSVVCYANGTNCPGGGNSSWNETRGNAIYYLQSSGRLDNTSWNETRANALYATIGSGGNSSWNETRANSLYLTISGIATNSNQLSGQVASYFLNTTGGTYDNATWNETRANALYATIGSGGNASWNETRANALYATIGSGGNSSWNQTFADARYLENGDNATFSTVNATGNAYVNGGVQVSSVTTYTCDFLMPQSTTMCSPYYFGAAITGTSAVSISNQTHPGVVTISSTAAANTGYRYQTDILAFQLNGSEAFRASLSKMSDTFANSTIVRLGFLDTTTQAAAVDGVYFEIINQSAGVVIRSNSATINVSTTNFTVVPARFYTFNLNINQGANSVNFTIYNDTDGSTVYTTTLTGALPTATGRQTGAGIVVTRTTAGIITPLVALDYLSTEIRTTRRPLGS